MMKKSSRVIMACVVVLVLTALSCGISTPTPDTAQELALQQTAVSLAQTQTAMAVPITQEVVTEAPPVVTEETPVVTEATPEPDICYEGICFSFDDSIAAGAVGATIPAENYGDEAMPGSNHPAYFEFTFTNYALASHFHTPAIRVYPIAEYIIMDDVVAPNLAEMYTVLATKPVAGINQNFPFMPFWNAAQVFTAKSAYFDFQSGSGLRYLTMYGQALYPIDNNNLFYTYQGITSDGQYYVSAILPVNNPGLPADGSSTIDDWEAFTNLWESYISQAVMFLEDWTPESYNPQLAMLDAMMQSLSIDR
jgi:hypothetical protein